VRVWDEGWACSLDKCLGTWKDPGLGKYWVRVWGEGLDLMTDVSLVFVLDIMTDVSLVFVLDLMKGSSWENWLGCEWGNVRGHV